jgi:outer membrane protein assembly factor BamD
MTLSALRRLGAGVVLVGLGVLAGCASTAKDEITAEQSAEKLYAEAKEDLSSGSWERAIKTLERVESRAGGTLLAQQAHLDLAYAQWKSGEKVLALATLDRFIKNNPSSVALDYALYLRGLVNFTDSLGFLAELADQQVAERDQRALRDAYQSFNQLIEQFPQSRYAQDARLRMDYTGNAMAEYELYVARYYVRRGAYLAALNRAQQVLTDFPQTPANEEALFIMVQSYDQLKLPQLRDDTQRILQKNFPKSRFLAGGAARADRSWWKFW